MAINFPDSPTLNQTFQQADRAWQWDGEKWKSTGTTSSSTVGATVVFEGATDDAYETTLTATDPTADRTITLPNASGTVAFTSDLSSYAPLASPTLTGTPAAPTAAANTNTTQVATTAFVMTEVGDYAPLADPTFTGNVTMQSLDMDDIVAGDVIYGSGADTLARLAKGSDDEVLTLSSGVPSWEALPSSGISWSGSTSNGLATYGSGSSVVAEPNATYDGNTLALTSASSQNLQVVTTAGNSNAQMKFQNDARHYNVGIAGTDSDKFNFWDETAGSTHLAIHSNGIVELETSGGGLKLNGLGSSGANVLDDYEEGSWTPAMTTNGSGTLTTSGSLGYIKIGRMVWVHGYFNVTAVSSPTGRASITGFPFTSENGSTTINMMHPIMVTNLSTDLNSLAITVEPNTTSAYMYGDFSTGGGYYYNTAETFSGNESVYLNMHYRASA